MNKDRQVASTGHPITFPLFLASDHITVSTGTIPVVYIAKNGGPWNIASGNVNEMGSGWYSFAGNAWDRDTVGELSIQATGNGVDRFENLYSIVPFDPYDSIRLGLTSLPNAPAAGSNGLPLNNQLPTISGIWSFIPRTTTMESGDYAYYADVNFYKNGSGSKDEYTVDWFRNTTPLGSSQISSPTLQVINRTNGGDLIAQRSLDYVSTSIGTLKWDESASRSIGGYTYITKVTASIDGQTRSWFKLIGRDG